MIATSGPTTAVSELQARVSELLASHLEVQVPHMGWNRERVRAHQRERLRGLLAHALARSPFHARRLAGIDPERFELADLAGLPVMSKAQMMDEFDQLLTNRRIARREVEAHLARSRVRPRLLYDLYVCLASGGSSGLRGIFVQTLDEWTQFVTSLARGPIAAITASGGLPSDGVQIGQIGAGSPVHSSGFGAATVTGFPLRFVSAPATLPLAEIVARLNAANPPALQGYPSVLRQLAGERRAGRLRIAPRSVTSLGETLTAQDRQAIAAGFGVAVSDLFVSTEGLVGRSQPGEQALMFASDMCIVELVDEQNQPVKPGSPSAKVLLTNLHNLTQPTPPTAICAPARKGAPIHPSATAASRSRRWRFGPCSRPHRPCSNTKYGKPRAASRPSSSPSRNRARTRSRPSSSRRSARQASTPLRSRSAESRT